MNEGPSVLLVSDDDDVAQPLVVALLRAGYRVGQARRQLGERLTRHAGRDAFPLIRSGVTVSKESDFVPADWHEDAVIVLPRPAHPGEVVTAVRAILRLSFYRTYRDLVHDLSQPVTVLHALSGALARDIPAGAPHHDRVMLLHDEVERMLSLMERFQRSRADRDR
jgi:DNA-binding response OmpR family regulator